MVNNSIGNSVTGCIRPETLDRLNVNDGGGQYDSSGGDGGQGNPQGSKCLGYVGPTGKSRYIFNALHSYNHYVELVEPADRRACIKCCDNFDDCPLDRGKDLCSLVSYIFRLKPLFQILLGAPMSSKAITSIAGR